MKSQLRLAIEALDELKDILEDADLGVQNLNGALDNIQSLVEEAERIYESDYREDFSDIDVNLSSIAAGL